MQQLAVRGIASSVKHGGRGLLKWTSSTANGTMLLPFIDDVSVDRGSLVNGEGLWSYTPIVSQKVQTDRRMLHSSAAKAKCKSQAASLILVFLQVL